MKVKKKQSKHSSPSFEKSLIALEYGEEKPIFKILSVDPNDYPSPQSMNIREVKRKLRKLKRILRKNSFVLELSEKLPDLKVYRYLVETLLYEKENIHLAKGYKCHVLGCDGDCTSCFQLDYCDMKYGCWTEEKLKKEVD